ncbi:hypothetical protein ACVXZ4_08250 [Lacisediminihabitans sp. FW035]
MSDWANIIAACASVLTAAFAILISLGLGRREKRQAIASVHVDLTTGETAAARDAIGSVLYARNGLRSVGKERAISSLFKLYWAVQRTENTYRVMNFRPDATGRFENNEEAFLSWNFREIVQNIVEFRRRYRRRLQIQDDDAWKSFSSNLRLHHPRLFEEFLGQR